MPQQVFSPAAYVQQAAQAYTKVCCNMGNLLYASCGVKTPRQGVKVKLLPIFACQIMAEYLVWDQATSRKGKSSLKRGVNFSINGNL